MFKKSRRKIVAAILSVLVLLLFGTFCVIYLASYVDMTNENRKLLEQYVEKYSLLKATDIGSDNMEWPNGIPDHPRTNPPRWELSTFYSVAISKNGQVLHVDTADISTFDDASLMELASKIIQSGKKQGVENNLIYRVADKGSYILVAFLDNTVMLENAGTLINYTLIFGGIALVLLFFLARFLANRIVAPLEESYKRQKQFISDAGHELKTPVAVVNANLDLLSREIGENQWLSNIQYENERMSALISQLLDLARTENVMPQMETVDLSRLVYGEMLPFETVAYENGLSLNSNIADNICIYGNSVQLKQLTSILLDNAIRHSANGKEVGLTLKEEKNNAILSVVNDGEEFPPEQRQYLFERFYRTDAARTGEDKHYGLGLAIAKAIAMTHKGTISVACYDGKVEFLVKLPLQNRNCKN
ncbi:MAG TPA: HAMP domain-containing histidine kinase [Firmicutes bacterium]|nr:HAMP domain-containing histidine kinase [Bacillota bacterium]